MSKLKLMTIIGTRPEIIRLSTILNKCEQYFNHILVHTGQNYDYTLNEIFFKELKIKKPDFYLNVVGENLGQTMGNIISKSYSLMVRERPDAVLILGDTNSALSAISAKRLKIPIFHMEAGNRCFDENLPEEINRKIVDHIADVNIPYTEHARKYLLSEGIRKEYTFVSGSPMREVLNNAQHGIHNSKILHDMGLKKDKYFIVSAHREENIDDKERFLLLMNSINAIAEKYKMPVIYSTHPRSQKYITQRNFKFHHLVQSLKPFGFFDYNKLQTNAYCVISDSGTLPEESAILGFPAVVIRTSTERPEAMEKGVFVLAGIKSNEVIQSVEMTRKMFEDKQSLHQVEDYQDGNVSDKIIKIIQSYTKIINEFIWKKQ